MSLLIAGFLPGGLYRIRVGDAVEPVSAEAAPDQLGLIVK
jgi:hypothetical protein